MFDTLHRDQRVSDTANILCLSAHDDHLEAVIVIQMDMHCGKNAVVGVMLNVRELLVE